MVFLIPHSSLAPMRLQNQLAESQLTHPEYTHADLHTSCTALNRSGWQFRHLAIRHGV
jgi:hypothetical protein